MTQKRKNIMGARHYGKHKPRNRTHAVKPTDRTPRVRVRPETATSETESATPAVTAEQTAAPEPAIAASA